LFPEGYACACADWKSGGSPITLIEQTVKANEHQKKLMAQKIEDAMGDLQGKQLGILGLAFKPNTDDIREAPSLTILNALAARGASFKVYDPIAMEEAKWRL
jgi:UDPglucose 6-dehydrogenase